MQGTSFSPATSRDVPTTKFPGRWKQLPSLNHHIQESILQLVLVSIPEHAQETLLQLKDDFVFLDCFPSQSWQTFFARSSVSAQSVTMKPSVLKRVTKRAGRWILPPPWFHENASCELCWSQPVIDICSSCGRDLCRDCRREQACKQCCPHLESSVGATSLSDLPIHYHQHGASRGRLQCGSPAASRRASSRDPMVRARRSRSVAAPCSARGDLLRIPPPLLPRGYQTAVRAQASRLGAPCRARSEGALGAWGPGPLHEVESDGTSGDATLPCEAAGASATGVFFYGSDDVGGEDEDGF